MPPCECGGQRTILGSWFSSIMGSGTELGLSRLKSESAFTGPEFSFFSKIRIPPFKHQNTKGLRQDVYFHLITWGKMCTRDMKSSCKLPWVPGLEPRLHLIYIPYPFLFQVP